jgi:hypothetical protein
MSPPQMREISCCHPKSQGAFLWKNRDNLPDTMPTVINAARQPQRIVPSSELCPQPLQLTA